MAIIVSNVESVIPVTKEKLFNYVRFHTKLTDLDFLGDAELCMMASVVEQDLARARKFITSTVTINWVNGDSDAELPQDFYELISYNRGDDRTPISVITDAEFAKNSNNNAPVITNQNASGVVIRFNGTSTKIYLQTDVETAFSDYLVYYSVPQYTAPQSWEPSFGENLFGVMSAKLIEECLVWKSSHPKMSQEERELAMQSIGFWQTKFNQAIQNMNPSRKATIKGSY